jgi:DNA-binding CsgD family transcriptional regulator/tetratricopeptide (TPR) repeat protein
VQPGRTLVERDEALAELHAALARVRGGRGEVALVTGEAGAGKTSVIGELIRHAAGRPTVLRGACDPLSTPRPLGPLIDAAGDLDRELARRLATGMPRVEAFAVALSLVDGSRNEGRATIFVVEDAHWADDATLDLLTFLGRRLAAWPTLLVISYRNDDVGLVHPLRARLGELSAAIRCRVHLDALSPAAVAELATGTTIDPNALHRMTGGNAFYVTEVLATGNESVPESIRDAVLARAASLPDAGRAVLDAAAVTPGRVEQWLLEAVAGEVDGRAGLEICVERGLLQLGAGRTVAFRHELARLAILEAQPSRRRQDFHRRALAALCLPHGGRPDPTRLAFHAAEADDVDAVLRYAPTAATDAAAIGAHREAAGHLETALRYRHRLEPAEAAGLLLRLGDELMTTGQPEAAVSAFNDAAATFVTISDVEGQAEAIVRCERPLVALGRQFEARDGFSQVTQLLEGHGPSRAAALVAMSQAAGHMLARQFDRAERDGQRAIALAEQIGDDHVLAEALIQSGIAVAMSGDDAGLARVRSGIDLATRIDADNLVSLGLTQIGSGLGELRRYDIAVPALREGIAFDSAREFVSSTQYASAWLARCELELGHWDEATAIAGGLAANPRCVGISRFVALLTLGWLRGRRGDPAVAPLLDEALEFARATRHLQRLWPVAACRAEIAWLENRLDDELGLLTEASSVAEELRYQPAMDELAHWLRIGDGNSRGDAGHARTPFGLSAAGRSDLAALRWAEIGCPYEQAMALFLSDEVDNLNAAHRIFDALGAAPMRTRTANALRATGAPVPRGPAASTRENPHLLTDREIEVLVLVATGRTDRQIAAELGISSKTVGHHVSHLLAKLDVRSRSEAAVAAERLGLLSHSRTNR